MKKKSLYFNCISLMIAVITFSFCIAEVFNGRSLNTSTNNISDYSNLSNKKICWGIKRADNHKQPDVGKTNVDVMEKYNSLFMGNSEKKYVYLTFDAGYEAGYTDKILEVLKQNNVTATFFITGHYLNTQPELIKKMIDNGNIVGNHAPNYLMSRVEKV
ncbi:MAG: polysaccharide deacetylase family protein [Clostridia bacterium]|nr:polysaccharide deacetylase family protein [Clostridia bacterium]